MRFRSRFSIDLVFLLALAGIVGRVPAWAQDSIHEGGAPPGRAAIHWTLHDDRWDFQQHPWLVDQLTSTGQARMLQVRPGNLFGGLRIDSPVSGPAAASGAPSFQSVLSRALQRVSGQPKPEIDIFVSSHGLPGVISRQGMAGQEIRHEELMRTIVRELEKRPGMARNVTVNLFVSACHSGSAQPALADQLRSRSWPDYRINLITSAPEKQVSHGNNLISATQRARELLGRLRASPWGCPGCEDPSMLAKVVHHFGDLFVTDSDRPQGWSTYRWRPWDPAELAAIAAVSDSPPARRPSPPPYGSLATRRRPARSARKRVEA